MTPLEVTVAVVTMVGVAWVLLAGSRSLSEAINDGRRWWTEYRDRRTRRQRKPTDVKPALSSIVTEVAASRVAQFEAFEERTRRLERSHQELERELVQLEQRYSEPARPPTVADRPKQIPLYQRSPQEDLSRFRERAAGQFARTHSLVDRQREVELIRKALLDSPNFKILYFYGQGGVGKTRVLEEAGHLVGALCSREGGGGQPRLQGVLRKLALWKSRVALPFVWCDIIDLYHTDLHDSLSVQQAILTALDPDAVRFLDYRRLIAGFQQARREGVDSSQLTSMRRQIDQTFVQEFNALAATQRVVFGFDTLETIQHESQVVQQACQTKPAPDSVEAWLLEHLCQFKNSVVLLASRPRKDLLDSFQEAYSTPGEFQAMELTGFTWPETQDYIKLLAQQRPEVESISEKILWRLYHKAEGLPVRLALALDLMLDRKLGEELTSSAQIDAVLGSNLFAGLQQGEPLMFYLALARKGLEAELLHHLKPEWSIDECRQRLGALRDLAYVKIRPGTGALFLHDELYALFDLFGPKRSEVARLYASIGEYYQTAQVKLGTERWQEAWQQVTANWLFYRLRANPREGYRAYVRLAEEAVKGHDFGFDMRLRDEMLRFLDDPGNRETADEQGVNRDAFDCDATLRWIRRYIEKGQYATACQVVTNVSQSGVSVFSQVEPLFSGTLDTYYGEATQYMGQALPEAMEALDRAVQCLSALQPADEFEVWQYARILGRAFNNIGYIHRQRQCYSLAAEFFQAATVYYRDAAVKDELADTLNNLAFVFGVLGRFAEAEHQVQEALYLRRELGQRYPLALSLNTLGLIHLGARRLEEAHKCCADALQIFEELDAARGRGLACIALGQVHRQMARRRTEASEAMARLREAETWLRQAIGIFDKQICEPLRLVEAANELGCTYRDIERWARQVDRGPIVQDYCDAQTWLERSIVEAKSKWPVLVADSCEDMARVFFERGMYWEARQWLERAAEVIPGEYSLREQKGFSNPPEPVEGFWLMLGKIHLLRGHLAYTIGDLHPSIQQYILALSYLEKYSLAVPASQCARSEISDRLKLLPIAHKEQTRQSARSLAEIYHVSANSLLGLLD